MPPKLSYLIFFRCIWGWGDQPNPRKFWNLSPHRIFKRGSSWKVVVVIIHSNVRESLFCFKFVSYVIIRRFNYRFSFPALRFVSLSQLNKNVISLRDIFHVWSFCPFVLLKWKIYVKRNFLANNIFFLQSLPFSCWDIKAKSTDVFPRKLAKVLFYVRICRCLQGR